VYRTDLRPALCQMFPTLYHCSFGSTQAFSRSTFPLTPKRPASPERTWVQIFSWAVDPNRRKPTS
jgi:hypothetical protein